MTPQNEKGTRYTKLICCSAGRDLERLHNSPVYLSERYIYREYSSLVYGFLLFIDTSLPVGHSSSQSSSSSSSYPKSLVS